MISEYEEGNNSTLRSSRGSFASVGNRVRTHTDRHSFEFRAGRRSSGKSEGGLEEDYHEPQAAACVIPLRPDYGPRTSSCRCDLEINVQSSVCYCTGPYW